MGEAGGLGASWKCLGRCHYAILQLGGMLGYPLAAAGASILTQGASSVGAGSGQPRGLGGWVLWREPQACFCVLLTLVGGVVSEG